MKIKVLTKRRVRGMPDFHYAPDFTFTFDPDGTDYDWLVVYDEMEEPEELHCSWQRTILATQEPVSVKSYSQAYVRQFAHYLTNRPFEAERHPGWYFGRGYYLWYNGHTFEELRTGDFSRKDRLISAVCSSKQMRHTAHHARLELVRRLAEATGDFDWFGRGVRPIEAKCDALDRYKYHVAVENHIASGHWSEKIADALLSECLPFYAGDPDIGQALPTNSFIPIPIGDPETAVSIIREAIVSGEYEKRRDAVREAKRLLLERYNFFAQVIELIREAKPVSGRALGRIYPRKVLRWRNPLVALSDGLEHLKQFMRMI